MAANRDERFLMRQRGVGTRDINLTFDLQLPGVPVPTISRSPLKPQKSGRLQTDSQTSRATRQTPKSTKARPKLAVKQTPATPRSATPGPLLPGDKTDTEVRQYVSKGVSARKRKVGQDLAEAATEDAELPPTKKRKKRKSIGQGSIRKKTKAPPLTKQTIPQSKRSTRSKNDDAPHAEPMEFVSVQIPQPPGVLSERGIVPDPEESLEAKPVANEPKRRKRKSIGQNQRPKKTPKITGYSMVHAILDDVGQQQIPVVVDNSVAERPQNVESPKPQRRTRNAVRANSKKPESSLQIAPSLSSAPHSSDRLRSETIQDQSTTNIDSAEQPRKRGRKPGTVVKATVELSKEVSSLPAMNPESQISRGEPPESEQRQHPGEAEPEASSVPKPTRKKRKPVGQTQKLGKKLASRPLRAIDPNVKLASAEIAKTQRTAASISPPTHQGRFFSENPQILPSKQQEVQIIPENNPIIPDPAPKKRGRPKKVQAAPQEDPAAPEPAQSEPENEIPTAPLVAKQHGRRKKAQPAPPEHPVATEPAQSESKNEIPTAAPVDKQRGRPKKAQAASHAAEGAEIESMHEEAGPAKAPKKGKPPKQKTVPYSELTLHEASKPSDNGAAPVQPRKRRAKNLPQPTVEEERREALPEVLDAPNTEPEHRALLPTPPKKRGRPKKQVNGPVTEGEAPKHMRSQLQKIKHRPNDALPSPLPIFIPKTRAKPAAVQNVLDDVDDDPLSECTPQQPIHKAKANPVKSRTQIHPSVVSQPPEPHQLTASEQSDLDEAPAIKVPKRRAKVPATEKPAPQKQAPEIVAHHPSPKSPSTSPQLQPGNTRDADLNSHIEQSLLEENALKAELEELHAQRAQEFEEQREYDRNVQMERMAASMKDPIGKDSHVSHRNESMMGGKKKVKGLGNLFRTVSGTRKGSGGGDIDPDLQGMLDQVKGVGATKLF
ncbi:MAG: hypothetical protein Q9168_004255 [Polycauliona sp. 1 TL-2023]